MEELHCKMVLFLVSSVIGSSANNILQIDDLIKCECVLLEACTHYLISVTSERIQT